MSNDVTRDVTRDVSHDASHNVTGANLSLAQRKEKLIREGANYRGAIRASRNVVKQNMHLDTVARNVVNHLTGGAYTALGNLFKLKSKNLPVLVPVALKVVSLLVKARLLGSALRATAIVGAVGAGAYVWSRGRKIQREGYPNQNRKRVRHAV